MSSMASSATSSVTSSTTTVDPASLTSAIGNNTMPVWAYFNTTVISTTVVEAFTTLCPEATTLTFNDCEYPATAGEIVVVTNCPCTVTTAVPTLTSSICPPEATVSSWSAPPPVVEVAPPGTTTTWAAVPTSSSSAMPSAPPVVQVAGASPVDSGSMTGLMIAVVAVAFGL
ncbi:hypothetical protein F5Y19DRAFT_476577 [Xylariaceae sp. FL1651]|nr:hypothetical protein F5Y19DRAFT_476577 [Xylariaceae sp. FL1651]